MTRLLHEEAPGAFVAYDLTGRITEASRKACEMLGYPAGTLPGLRQSDIELPKESGEKVTQWDRFSSGETFKITRTYQRRDGSQFMAEVHATVVQQGDEKILLTLVQDLSEQEQLRHRLDRQFHIYQALSEINQAIVRLDSEADLFPLICRIAVVLGGMKMAWIVKESQPGVLETVAAHGTEDAGGTALVALSGHPDHPTVVAWNQAHSVIRNAWVPKGSKGAFPILRRGKIYAVLTVYHGDEGAFDPTITNLLDEMTGDVSFALDAFDRDAALKRSAKTVKAQNEFLKAVLEAEPECVLVVSPNGKLVHINPAGLSVFEVDNAREVQQMGGLMNFVRPEFKAAYRSFSETVSSGANSTLEFSVVGKQGTLRWLEAHGTPLRNPQGEVTAVLSVMRDVTEKRRSNETIWRQANFDQLTELPNRHMFYDLLGHEIKKAKRDETSMAVLFIDLDRFKEVNDNLGHQTGDLLLMEAARRITSCVRESDTVARLGGDEFTVILPQLKDVSRVETIAGNILQRLSAPFELTLDKRPLHISASIGITFYPTDSSEIETLISNADQAMYAAKNAGRNQFSFFTRSLQEKAQSRLRLLDDLREALKNDQLSLHFQPVINLDTGQIDKAESLLRWQHPRHGSIAPAEFIPLAEESGMISDIGDLVFREASRWASRWVRKSPGFKVTVNMSPGQFQVRKSVLDAWMDHLKSLGISGDNMIIEITENLLLDKDPSINRLLNNFRDSKIQVAIDDFGTGYSSLSYINHFPIDYLKIDRSFTQDLVTPGSRHLALSKAIIVMGHELGLEVIAEGIENSAQRDLLLAAGCDFGQGYLFAQPIPPRAFESSVFRSSGAVSGNMDPARASRVINMQE